MYPLTSRRRTAGALRRRTRACDHLGPSVLCRRSGLLVCAIATIVAVQAIGAAAAEPRAAAWSQAPRASAASFRPSEPLLGPTEKALRDRSGAHSGSRNLTSNRRENSNPLASIFDAETFSTQLSDDFRDPLGHFDPGVGGQMAQAMQ